MKKKDPIIIEQTANGWIVRPLEDIRNGGVVLLSDTHVFQHFDAGPQGATSECLFGFLRSHFEK